MKWGFMSRAFPRDLKKRETNLDPLSDVTWEGTPCLVFGKYMDNEELSQLSRSDGVVCGDENALLGETIYHYQDSGKPFRNWEVFNEIHGNRIPQTGRDGKLMEKTVRLVVLGLVLRTSCTRSTIVSNKCANTQPSILSAD